MWLVSRNKQIKDLHTAAFRPLVWTAAGLHNEVIGG